ncbi:MAG: radical SAM protein [Myxococcales bacterium]|nr:radical SAM protein [Myxococcales bacterium]
MSRRSRSHIFYDVARSICSTCLTRVDAKILIEGDRVLLDKWCLQHGRERVLIADDATYWKAAREQWLKPAEVPQAFQTPMRWGCPYDCGVCPDHQQHACVTLIEVNDHCNLSCPICYASSGPHRMETRSLAEVEAMLDAAVAAEGQPDVVQISGGEPTLHPQFFEILDAAKARPIRHIMVNTNGLRIAKDPAFVERLATYQPRFEIYLQFDSLRDDVLVELRGARLAEIRQQALENLERVGLSTTLVVTLEKGLNDDEIGEIIEHALTWRCVRGVTLQPVQEAGRVEGYDPQLHRLTLTEVRRKIHEQSDHFSPDDLLPVPCHPDALVMGYALKLEGQVIPLTRYAGPERLLGGPQNTIVFEEIPELKQAVVSLFSTGIGPEDQAGALGELLCCLPRLEVPNLSYDNVFRVLIVRFSDVRDFDLRSVKRCCLFFAQPDGHMIPFDTWNLFYRPEHRERLERLRALALPAEPAP